MPLFAYVPSQRLASDRFRRPTSSAPNTTLAGKAVATISPTLRQVVFHNHSSPKTIRRLSESIRRFAFRKRRVCAVWDQGMSEIPKRQWRSWKWGERHSHRSSQNGLGRSASLKTFIRVVSCPTAHRTVGVVHSYEPYEPKRDMMDRDLHREWIAASLAERQLLSATTYRLAHPMVANSQRIGTLLHSRLRKLLAYDLDGLSL